MAPKNKAPRCLRVYSQNVCVLPAGARERHLQVGGLLGVALIAAGAVAVALSSPLIPTPVLVCLALLLLSGAVVPVGIHAAFAALGMWQLLLGRHDFKRERLAVLADRLVSAESGEPLYDLVLLQEFFGSWYSDANRRWFVAVLAEKGYSSAALPRARPRLPSTWANSGLAIFSPHPLHDVQDVPFRKQLIYDRFAVNRGAIGATVELPGGRRVRAFSAHFGPPLSVLDLFAALPTSVQAALDVFPSQVAHLGELVADCKVPTVVGGDFNAQVHGDAYAELCGSLADLGLEHLTGAMLEAEGAPTTVNMPGERTLTGGGRPPKTLDFVFASRGLLRGGAECGVEPQRTPEEPFEFVSDHAGVFVVGECGARRSRARSKSPGKRTAATAVSSPRDPLDRLERLVRWAEGARLLGGAEAAKLTAQIAVARTAVDRNLVWIAAAQRSVEERATETLRRAGLSFEFFSVAYQQRLLAVLFFFAATGYVNALSSAAAGWRTPRIALLDLDGRTMTGQTLPDLGHDLVGVVVAAVLPEGWVTPEGAVAWEAGPDTLVQLMSAAGILLLLLHPQRFKIVRRVLAIYALLNLLRSVTVIVTSLPDASPICARQWTDPNGTGAYKRRAMFPEVAFRAALLTAEPAKHTTCGDMIFSGHTTVVTLVAKVFGEYCHGKRLNGLTRFPEYLARWVWIFAIFGIAVIISTKLHYTLDVLLAVILTHRVFESYHTVARLLVLREGSPVMRWLEADEVRALEYLVYVGEEGRMGRSTLSGDSRAK